MIEEILSYLWYGVLLVIVGVIALTGYSYYKFKKIHPYRKWDGTFDTEGKWDE